MPQRLRCEAVRTLVALPTGQSTSNCGIDQLFPAPESMLRARRRRNLERLPSLRQRLWDGKHGFGGCVTIVPMEFPFVFQAGSRYQSPAHQKILDRHVNFTHLCTGSFSVPAGYDFSSSRWVTNTKVSWTCTEHQRILLNSDCPEAAQCTSVRGNSHRVREARTCWALGRTNRDANYAAKAPRDLHFRRRLQWGRAVGGIWDTPFQQEAVLGTAIVGIRGVYRTRLEEMHVCPLRSVDGHPSASIGCR